MNESEKSNHEKDLVVPTEDQERVLHYKEPAHEASRFDAGTGQGTYLGDSWDDEALERPVLDGTTETPVVEDYSHEEDHIVGEPRAVYEQPALNTASSKRWLAAGAVSAILLWVPLAFLMEFDSMIAGSAIIAILILLLAMIFVRRMLVPRNRSGGLRSEAMLLIIMWFAGITAIVFMLATHMSEISAMLQKVTG